MALSNSTMTAEQSTYKAHYTRNKRSLANAEKRHRLGIVKVNFPSPLGSSVL